MSEVQVEKKGYKLPVDIPDGPEEVTIDRVIADTREDISDSWKIFRGNIAEYSVAIEEATWWRFWIAVFAGSFITAVLFTIGQSMIQARLGAEVSTVPFFTLIFTELIVAMGFYLGCEVSHWYASSQSEEEVDFLKHAFAIVIVWLTAVILLAIVALISLTFTSIWVSIGFVVRGGLPLMGAVPGFAILLALVGLSITLYSLATMNYGIKFLYKFEPRQVWITLGIFLITNAVVIGMMETYLPG